jgi:hypothetical protein
LFCPRDAKIHDPFVLFCGSVPWFYLLSKKIGRFSKHRQEEDQGGETSKTKQKRKRDDVPPTRDQSVPEGF